jgi:NO-binding membrane sensor protein with MHYT domain
MVAQSLCRVLAVYVIKERTDGGAVIVSGISCIHYVGTHSWRRSHCVRYYLYILMHEETDGGTVMVSGNSSVHYSGTHSW